MSRARDVVIARLALPCARLCHDTHYLVATQEAYQCSTLSRQRTCCRDIKPAISITTKNSPSRQRTKNGKLPILLPSLYFQISPCCSNFNTAAFVLIFSGSLKSGKIINTTQDNSKTKFYYKTYYLHQRNWIFDAKFTKHMINRPQTGLFHN